MIIIRMIGGLGNQMFQYAFYKNLKEKYGHVKCDINGFENYKLHNGFELENNFDIKIEKATLDEIQKSTNFYNRNIGVRLIRKYFGYKKTHIKEKNFKWDSLATKNDLYLDGYWQNDIFFGNTKNLRDDFKFLDSPSDNELYKMIKSSNAISLHVRRGDYVGNAVYTLLSEEYYATAMDLISKQVENPTFYVFSDDLEWAEKMLLSSLKLKHNIIFYTNGKSSAIQDMKLMSSCKHNVIANSSFSWWGAWLNDNETKIVVYPSQWYSDPKVNKEHIDTMPSDWLII